MHDTCEWRDLSSFVMRDKESFWCKTRLVCYLIMAALSASADAISSLTLHELNSLYVSASKTFGLMLDDSWHLNFSTSLYSLALHYLLHVPPFLSRFCAPPFLFFAAPTPSYAAHHHLSLSSSLFLSSSSNVCFDFKCCRYCSYFCLPSLTPLKPMMLASNLALRSHGHIVSIPASYLGSPMFKFWPRDWISWQVFHSYMTW